jgi:hypothetical protein
MTPKARKPAFLAVLATLAGYPLPVPMVDGVCALAAPSWRCYGPSQAFRGPTLASPRVSVPCGGVLGGGKRQQTAADLHGYPGTLTSE